MWTAFCSPNTYEVARLVHRARLENDDVHGIEEAAVVVRDLAKIEGHVGTASAIVTLPVVAGEVPAEPEKVFALRIAFHHRARPHREAGADLYVLQRLAAGCQRFVEHIWLAQADAVIEPHA
jgi:hypothetical protein